MSVKYTCGPIDPSGCILYTGEVPTFVKDPSCNMMLDELLEKYGDTVKDILSSIDLKLIDKKSLVFDPAIIDIKGLHQIEINAIDDHSLRISTLETHLEDFAIGDKLLNIDLKCLTPIASPCAQGTNNYSILSLFTILFNEICQIKSQLT